MSDLVDTGTPHRVTNVFVVKKISCKLVAKSGSLLHFAGLF